MVVKRLSKFKAVDNSSGFDGSANSSGFDGSAGGALDRGWICHVQVDTMAKDLRSLHSPAKESLDSSCKQRTKLTRTPEQSIIQKYIGTIRRSCTTLDTVATEIVVVIVTIATAMQLILKDCRTAIMA
eukprot:5537857-Amphidinium_carterae.1